MAHHERISEDRVDELLRVLRTDRHSHSPEEIAAAESELSLLARAGRDDMHTRMRRAGRITAFIGFFIGIWPPILLAVMLLTGPEVFRAGRGDFADRYAPLLIAGALTTQTALGFLLFAAGLAFRRRQPWGRMVVAGFLWFLVLYCCAVPFVMPIIVLVSGEGIAFAILAVVLGGLVAAFYVMILRIPLRFFRSDAARYWCGSLPPGPGNPNHTTST